jgi:proteic killer suppression protein
MLLRQMIRDFADAETERLFRSRVSRRFPREMQRAALRKLTMLHAAATLGDLRTLPGNHLERLASDRAGQHSIRINSQYRLCFAWEEGHAYEVEITDYH